MSTPNTEGLWQEIDARWRASSAGEALFDALQAGNAIGALELLPHADATFAEVLEHAALHAGEHAAECGRGDMVRLLLREESLGHFPAPRRAVSRHHSLSDLLFAYMAVARLVARGRADASDAGERRNGNNTGGRATRGDRGDSADAVDDAVLQAVAERTLETVRIAVEGDASLIVARNWLGHTLLHSAATGADPGVVAMLLELGAEVDARDELGHTPLAHLSNRLCDPASTPPDDGSRAATHLIAAGADVNARCGVERQTPLHMAARRGNVPLGRLLIAHGAELDARSTQGETPLHRAVSCNQVAFAAFLLHSGADAHLPDGKGKTPRHKARSPAVRTLLSGMHLP